MATEWEQSISERLKALDPEDAALAREMFTERLWEVFRRQHISVCPDIEEVGE